MKQQTYSGLKIKCVWNVLKRGTDKVPPSIEAVQQILINCRNYQLKIMNIQFTSIH
jgi:hypothetical protein